MNEEKEIKEKIKARNKMSGCGTSGALYGLGFIGALVYYLQHATTLWLGVIGFFKAIVWPALIVYKVLELLKM